MSRTRYIKPDFPTDKTIARLTRECRYFYILLWTQLDRQGVCEFDPDILKSTLYPLDSDISGNDLLKWCQELSTYGRIKFFEKDQTLFAYVPSFERNQSFHSGEKVKYKIDFKTIEFIDIFQNGCLEAATRLPLGGVTKLNQTKPKIKGSEPISEQPEIKTEPIGSCPPIVSEVLNFLNMVCKTKHRPNKQNKTLILARASEGFDFKDFQHVINVKAQDWKDDSKMNVFLRPSTLFRPTKFQEYLAQPYDDFRDLFGIGPDGKPTHGA